MTMQDPHNTLTTRAGVPVGAKQHPLTAGAGAYGNGVVAGLDLCTQNEPIEVSAGHRTPGAAGRSPARSA